MSEREQEGKDYQELNPKKTPDGLYVQSLLSFIKATGTSLKEAYEQAMTVEGSDEANKAGFTRAYEYLTSQLQDTERSDDGQYK